MKPTQLNASTAGGQIFFDHASCGLLPLAQALHRALAEADVFSEVWKSLVRGMRLSRLIIRPGFRFRCEDSRPRSATALVVSATYRESSEVQPPSFAYEAWKHSAFEHLGALAGASFGADWRRSGHHQQFECTRLAIDQKRATWLLLDGVPRRFDGPVEFAFVRNAIQTFAFSPRAANDSASRPSHGGAARRPSAQGTFRPALTFPNLRPAVVR